MIYKLTFEDGRIDWCTANNEIHLLQSYDLDFDLPLHDIKSLQSITDEEAKTIMVKNTEFIHEIPEEISLFDLSVGEDFAIIASTEYD